MLKLFRGWARPRADEALPSPPRPSALESHTILFGAQAPRHAALSTVVVIGNCIAESIVEGLSNSDAKSRFRFVVIPIHVKSVHDAESRSLLAGAGHVFVQQFHDIDLSVVNSLVGPDCQLLKFPSLAMHSLWPFDSANGFPDEVAQNLPENRIRHFDGGLASLRRIETDKKKRIARYRELDFPLASKIESIHRAQARYLQYIDDRSDCKIGRFIERHQRERPLFHNSHHPTELVFQELCEQCLAKLGLPNAAPHFLRANGWEDWSVPVHPLIAQRIGVAWAHDATRYRYFTLGDITWKEWVEAYVDDFG